MHQSERRETVRAADLAIGKWSGLLGKWLDERALLGKHTGCPMCGGKDRFRFDDKDGRGSWICSHCGAGDGLHLLQNINGWTFQEAARYVEAAAGKIKAEPAKPVRTEEDIRASLRRTWEQATPIEQGDPVWTYLHARCSITHAPRGLRYHPALPYIHDDRSKTLHPAMLAQVIGHDGAAVSIHRTYLTLNGQKADIPNPKRLMTPTRKMENVAVRLSKPVDGWMGVAEGIETALCAASRFQTRVWACISAGMLETFRPPEDIKMVTIFADNDRSYTGQSAAYRLARYLVNEGIECFVEIPPIAGTDWADRVSK